MKRSVGSQNNSSNSFLLHQSMMLICVILLSVATGVWWEELHAAALPASTVQVRLGENATLQCPLLVTLNTSIFVPSTLSWYRKSAGRRPELLVSFRSTNRSKLRFGFGVRPDKVSAAADGSLLLHGSQRSDSAVYYCGISQGIEPNKKRDTGA